MIEGTKRTSLTQAHTSHNLRKASMCSHRKLAEVLLSVLVVSLIVTTGNCRSIDNGNKKRDAELLGIAAQETDRQLLSNSSQSAQEDDPIYMAQTSFDQGLDPLNLELLDFPNNQSDPNGVYSVQFDPTSIFYNQSGQYALGNQTEIIWPNVHESVPVPGPTEFPIPETTYFSDCGGVYNLSAGEITSPNYPNEYSNNMRCEYKIIAPEDHEIVLNFTDLNIESDRGTCAYDALSISERPGFICGTSVPDSPIVSTRNEVTIVFLTDQSVTKTGFRIEYTTQQRQRSDLNGDDNVDNFTSPIGNSSSTDVPELSDTKGCYEEFKASSGVITSPNYPSNYPNDDRCIYRIKAPEGQQIVLKITDIHLEFHKFCAFDRLSISQQTGYFCGNQVPSEPIVSSGNEMTLEFRSDHSLTARGFRIEYSTLPRQY